MHERLKWNAIGLQNKTLLLKERISEEKTNTPPENLKDLRKIQLYLDELSHLLEIMDKIQCELIPKLEEIFRVKYKTPELVMLALTRPSIRNIYDDLEKFFNIKLDNPLKPDEYKQLATSGYSAEVLALVGDRVIDLAVVQLLWDNTSATVGKITEKKKEIVSNENLSRVCELWKLFNYRLGRLQAPVPEIIREDTIEHEKGTLVEALYGVIYLEFGLQEVFRTLGLLQIR
jgi:ribonuclease-3